MEWDDVVKGKATIFKFIKDLFSGFFLNIWIDFQKGFIRLRLFFIKFRLFFSQFYICLFRDCHLWWLGILRKTFNKLIKIVYKEN